jgi:hypothetical protein
MYSGIPESDWKKIRDLKPVLLDRLCQRILQEVAVQATEPSKTSHERYLAVYRLIHDRDRDIAEIFNGLSRSNAMMCILNAHRHGLMTDDELGRFSEDIRAEAHRFFERMNREDD